MNISIRCPKCGRRLFDVDEKTIGPITLKCKCKGQITYHSKEKIEYKK